MPIPLVLAGGQRLDIDGNVTEWDVRRSDDGSGVKLTASIFPGYEPPLSQHLSSNVTLTMDAFVCMELHRKLDDLGRSMGWLPKAP